MRIKRFLLFLVAVFALASCADNETLSGNHGSNDGDEIVNISDDPADTSTVDEKPATEVSASENETKPNTDDVITEGPGGSYPELKPLTGRLPNVTSETLWAAFYGDWGGLQTVENFIADGFKLVIIEPHTGSEGIHKEMVSELRSNGVLVFCYITIGEDDHLHDESAYQTPKDPKNPNIASWYQDANNDGNPDQSSTWGSYYINVSDQNWKWALKNFRHEGTQRWYGYDYMFNELGCDGVYFDTVNTVSPYHNFYGMTGPYVAQIIDMVELIASIREDIPVDKYIMINGGRFYFLLDEMSAALAPLVPNSEEKAVELRDKLRRMINAMKYEDYFTYGYVGAGFGYSIGSSIVNPSPYWNENKLIEYPVLREQSELPDGFNVLVQDFIDSNLSDEVKKTIAKDACYESIGWNGWSLYLTHKILDEESVKTYVRDYCLEPWGGPVPPKTMHPKENDKITLSLFCHKIIDIKGLHENGCSALGEKDSNGGNDFGETVSFSKNYDGEFEYLLPEMVLVDDVRGLRLRVNYYGDLFKNQKWMWLIYNNQTQNWEDVGSNDFVSNDWFFTENTFQIGGEPANYIKSGVIRLRYKTDGDSDVSDLDYQVILIELE